MIVVSPVIQPWLDSVARLEDARMRLRTLGAELDPLIARVRALDAATAWQSSALGPFHRAMAELIEKLDELRVGFEVADLDITAEQDHLRAIAGVGR